MGITRDLGSFYRECWREAHSRAWAQANGLFGGLVGLVGAMLIPLDLFPDHPNWSKVLTFVIYAVVAYAVFLLFMLAFVVPFLIWRKERTARLLLTAQSIKPRLKCSFDKNGGCFWPNTVVTSRFVNQDGLQVVSQQKCDWYRLKMDAEGGSIAGCQARLISIKRDDVPVFIGDTPPLQIAHHGEEEPTTVHEGVSEYIDFMAIYEDNRVNISVSPNRRTSALDWDNMFSEPGNYLIRVAGTSPEAVRHWTCARLHNVFGEGQHSKSVIACDPPSRGSRRDELRFCAPLFLLGYGGA